MILDGEKELHPDAFNETNGSNDCGVFQISQRYHPELTKSGDCFDIKDNIRMARELYDKSGLRPWVHSSKEWMK